MFAELIERLEKLTGSDRLSDAEIECAVSCPALFDGNIPPLEDGWRWAFEADDDGSVNVYLVLGNKVAKKHRKYSAPQYTGSIDGALALLLPGVYWCIANGRTRPDEPLGAAKIISADDADTVIAEAEAATPTIALVIAALRARASLAKQEAQS